MTKTLAARRAARLTELAARRRGDGSRGPRARRAWQRLVQACAAGDPAALDAVRSVGLPEADVLDLLHVAPDEPADRAAYLALLGQTDQRRALDPDGSLLALAYRAAAPEVRERLRAVMAAEGDADVIRVVVTGDRRDRLATMSYEELDYLSRQLAEHGSWAELRRLALDLPLAKAAATARVLPAEERTGERGALLTALAGFPPERLAATVERLPREQRTSYTVGKGVRVSFSRDQAELAVLSTRSSAGVTQPDALVETIRIATGESTLHIREEQTAQRARNRADLLSWVTAHSVLHMGDELYYMDLCPGNPPVDAIIRVRPRYDEILLKDVDAVSGMMGRASTGVVAVTSSGLVFVDRGATRPRYVSVPRIAAEAPAIRWPKPHTGRLRCTIATLPESRLIAIATTRSIIVVDEDGTVFHYRAHGANTVSFLGPKALAFVSDFQRTRKVQILSASGWIRHGGGQPPDQVVFDRIRTLASGSWPYPPAERAMFQRAFTSLWEHPLDSLFAGELYGLAHHLPVPIAVSTQGDMIVTRARSDAEPASSAHDGIEVHNFHLPSAREALEQPLLHTTPRQWHRVRELRTKIGDPAVREALDLLARALEDRFGADIALGTVPVSPGGPHDIALGADRTE